MRETCKHSGGAAGGTKIVRARGRGEPETVSSAWEAGGASQERRPGASRRAGSKVRAWEEREEQRAAEIINPFRKRQAAGGCKVRLDGTAEAGPWARASHAA